jgi:8-oxo-dGTP diphosphatase
MRVVQVSIGIIQKDGKLLITRRGAASTYSGLWEFPGGKVEPHETAEAAVLRELNEELGVQVRIKRVLDPFEFAPTPDKKLLLMPFVCDIAVGEPRPIESSEMRWVHPATLIEYEFPPANAEFIRSLPRLLASHV